MIIFYIASLLIATVIVESLVPQDGNSYFIINKVYPHARLAMWGTGYRQLGTHEEGVYPDQIWNLEAYPDESDTSKTGYFYIKNADIRFKDYRVGRWGNGWDEVGAVTGKYYLGQLWKFVPVGDYFRIYNFAYPREKMSKPGRAGDNWGTFRGADYEDQLWKLVPRFEAVVYNKVLWHTDNRRGSAPFTEEVTFTKGLKTKSTGSFSKTVGLRNSLEMSAGVAIGPASLSAKATTEFSREMTTTMTSENEQTWSKTNKIRFTAPAGKNYRVLQTDLSFKSDLAGDDCVFSGNYKVEETDGSFYN